MGGYALAEDEDFSYRLSRLGRIRYAPEIVVEHRKLGFGSHDPRRLGRLVVVNRAYLFRKNFPGTALARAQFPLRGDARGPPDREPPVAGALRVSWRGLGTPGAPGGADTLGNDIARRKETPS